MDFSKYTDLIKEINSIIDNALQGEPKILYDAAKHIIQPGGKRIRPLLCVLSCRAVNGKDKDALKTAAAIELIHTFTLIHDDIMDRDDFRRGVLAVHKAYDEPTAILAGDLLFSKAFELSDERVFRILAEATVKICEGQLLDMVFEKRTDVSIDEYLEMIKKKTAVLLMAATKSGAILGNGSTNEIKALSNFGFNLGLAFQIQDDLLGLLGDEEKLGKPVGSDIAEGKKNVIIIKILESSKREELLKLINRENITKEDIEKVIKLAEETGAISFAKSLANKYASLAIKELSQIRDSDAKHELREIAEFVVSRDF